MPAYVLVEVEVHDAETYETYKKLAPASIAAYHGRYLARGGKVEPLEGDWAPGRLVILEFPTLEQAKAWWASPDYAHAKSMRQASARTQMIVIEGVETRSQGMG
jgi:uncharacterized protein (DUF1330 family)